MQKDGCKVLRGKHSNSSKRTQNRKRKQRRRLQRALGRLNRRLWKSGPHRRVQTCKAFWAILSVLGTLFFKIFASGGDKRKEKERMEGGRGGAPPQKAKNAEKCSTRRVRHFLFSRLSPVFLTAGRIGVHLPELAALVFEAVSFNYS